MELSKRKDMRLKDYDYSQNGAYFITICVKAKHEPVEGDCRDDRPGRPQAEGDRPQDESSLPFVELAPLGTCIGETIQVVNKDSVKN